jgi:Flp pilus assembly protein TadG
MIGRAKGIARLLRDVRGTTALEFGFIALPLVMFITGGLEYGWRAFATSVLQGELDRAARASETENLTNADIDLALKTALKPFAAPADILITRTSFEDFSHIRPETLTYDANGNGVWDSKDCFIDANGNGKWDADLGQAGRGGAQDVMLYKVTMSYAAMTPIEAIIGRPGRVILNGSTIVKNQPFASQTSYNYKDASTPICPT